MKTFVIDTNVLLHDPEALLKFERNEVVIPVTVLEELDKMKRLPGELGNELRVAFLAGPEFSEQFLRCLPGCQAFCLLVATKTLG